MRMYHDRGATDIGDRTDVIAHEAVFITVIAPNAWLDSDVNRDRFAHRLDAVGTSCGLLIMRAPNAPFYTRPDG